MEENKSQYTKEELEGFEDFKSMIKENEFPNTDVILEFISNYIEEKFNPIQKHKILCQLNGYTEGDLKKYAFYAVQYAFKLLKENPSKIITKEEIDKYIESELY